MADNFVDIEIVTEEQTLADDAIAKLEDAWTDWEPNQADMEVVLIEAISPMVANAASVAAQMPAAALRAIGEKLYGIPYDAGNEAAGTVSFTLGEEDRERLIPAGYEIDIGGWAFTVDSDVTAAIGVTSVLNVPVTAREVGTDQNGLTGPVAPIDSLTFVDLIAVASLPSGGEDEMDAVAYQDKVTRALEMRGETLVTTRHFTLYALNWPGIGRALVIGNTARAMAVYVTDAAGLNVPTGTKNELLAAMNEYRQVNTTITINDPTRTTINVTYTIKASTGFDLADLETRADEALATALDPKNWGRPLYLAEDTETTIWENEPIVYKNVLIDVLSDVQGVRRVETVTISGSAGSADGSGNWTMPGTVPLPTVGTMTGTVNP